MNEVSDSNERTYKKLNVVYNEEEEYVQIKEENKEKREVGSSVGKMN
jgi:hypothetical protein